MSNEIVKVDELLDFIQTQLRIEEEAASMYRNHTSSIELRAYYRAMEDVQLVLSKIKFEQKPKRTRKKANDQVSKNSV